MAQIEIEGGKKLADLNRFLVNQFKHESDHMAGFWKLIRRGNTKRFREVEVATIDPFGDGEGANKFIAGLELQPGDKLKYVYDFGDWFEYIIELEAINDPEKEVQYPRVAAQNKPRYQYCSSCHAQGRKTIAVYICINCSNRRQQDALLCKECIEPDHEDHYLDEIIY